MATPIPIPSRQLFIDGEWREPIQRKRIPIFNPSTEEIIGEIPAATAGDVELAVDAARRAFSRNKGTYWASTSGAYRAKFLRAIAAKLTEKKSELAKLEALDCGKPLDEAAWDMDDVAGCFEYYAGLAEALDTKQKSPLSLPMDTFKGHVLKEPLGVIALITPWNYPLLMGAWKVAPALAAGCTAILKPSELASVSVSLFSLSHCLCVSSLLFISCLNVSADKLYPLYHFLYISHHAFSFRTCLELAEICKEVGLPVGVLNIVTGLGAEAGAPLAAHPHVDKIAFTGSALTGSKIMASAAQMVKPVSLELGGKSPIVVFEDIDLEKAAEWTLFGCFWTNGQICSATSRLLVHESIAAKFLEKLVNWSRNIKISDPIEEGCRLGPVVSEGQYEKIKKFIETAKSEGATILCGGKRPQHLKKGYFIEPTIITDVDTSMQIWREEVFGPVLCVKTFSNEDEAIELANDSDYGLAAAVISNDLERCERVSKAFRAGIVWINCSQPCFCQAPWGGIKRSGFGRELGEWGLENYLSVKQVTRYISEEPWGWYQAPSNPKL